MDLNWRTIDAYCIKSYCGAYTVCKIGGDRGITYESWCFKNNLAVGFQTAEAAKAHCESHLQQQTRAAA